MVDEASKPLRGASPFDLSDNDAYLRWRARKLQGFPRDLSALQVEIADPARPTEAELGALLQAVAKANMAVYQVPPETGKDGVTALGAHLGLTHLDGNLCADEDRITSLQVRDSGRRRGYIPYSNRPLQWHTDGYYNEGGRQVRAWLLHCRRAAAEGGENQLMDPEIVYILLRDADPGHIAALMQADVMTIPANVENGVLLRPAHSGPVFSVDPRDGALHMRYTARRRNIEWKPDAAVQAAVRALEAILASDSPYKLRALLMPGQGVVSNNVLHNRAGFRDDPQHGRTRLLYRARYYERLRAA
jgi:hypothetical protein